MVNLVLKRMREDSRQTLGSLFVLKDSKELFKCYTLELPWKDNKKYVSRIPAGTYDVIKYQSPNFGDSLWIRGVEDRTLILIHYGNYNKDTQGCILVGNKVRDIDGDGYPDVVHSKKTMTSLINSIEDVDMRIQILDIAHIDKRTL